MAAPPLHGTYFIFRMPKDDAKDPTPKKIAVKAAKILNNDLNTQALVQCYALVNALTSKLSLSLL